jgi:hypothetical protein
MLRVQIQVLGKVLMLGLKLEVCLGLFCGTFVFAIFHNMSKDSFANTSALA